MLAYLSPDKVVRITLLFLLVMCGCLRATKFSHSPAMAAREAQRFAQMTFIDRNLTTAYSLLSENTRNDLPFEQFREVVLKMHAAKYPALVKAVEFEPIPRQKEMNICLVGESGDEKFYYRFVMDGTLETNYEIAGFWRNMVRIRPQPR